MSHFFDDDDEDFNNLVTSPQHTSHFPTQQATSLDIFATNPDGSSSSLNDHLFETNTQRMLGNVPDSNDPDFDETTMFEEVEKKNHLKSFYTSVKNLFIPKHQLIERKILFNAANHPEIYPNKSLKTVNEVTSLYPVGPYAPNIVNNQKYNVFNFIFLFLYNEFRFFFNMYFLLVALSQFIPVLQVGFLFTYVSPLAMVLFVSMVKEIYDDFQRFRRDTIANSEKYETLRPDGHYMSKKSSELVPGDVLVLETGQRVPCDCILLKSFDKSGTVFIKTDQLDGETDWKLRLPVVYTHGLSNFNDVFSIPLKFNIEKPKMDIYDFIGNIEFYNTVASAKGDVDPSVESLSLDNTLWGNTTVASASVIAVVIYTGKDTRSSLNANEPRTKTGLLDLEVNFLAKVLFFLTLAIAGVMTVLKGITGDWYIYLFRYIILFSSIIPISLRVNLEMGKLYYSHCIQVDDKIEGTIVRTSSIPEELGRIGYIFSDKTGTLTTNTMKFKVLQLAPPLSFSHTNVDSLKYYLHKAYLDSSSPSHAQASSVDGVNSGTTNSVGMRGIYDFDLELEDHNTKMDTNQEDKNLTDLEKDKYSGKKQNGKKNPVGMKHNTNGVSDELVELSVRRAMEAIALCHNVTPINDSEPSATNADSLTDGDLHDELLHDNSFITSSSDIGLTTFANSNSNTLSSLNTTRQYQGSSPDEVSLISFAAECGLPVVSRDTHSITLTTPSLKPVTYSILANFPFSSSTKRMGIVLKNDVTQEITFIVKGAESVMIPMLRDNFWVMEEVSNLARIGLRTLVYGSKPLSHEEYQTFTKKYNAAKASLVNRDEEILSVMKSLEHNLNVVCVTAVEDLLQDNIRQTIEMIRNGGVKVWMLTGDKAETANCIAISTKLIDRNQEIHWFSCATKHECMKEIEILQSKLTSNSTTCVIIDGSSLQVTMDSFPLEFFTLTSECPAVVCCRCSPTQKAEVIKYMKKVIKASERVPTRTLAIGDGGNDVSMIQAADVGIGIVGKEGNQAAMAADFSILEFQYLSRLILWHGRNSYKRSSGLAQFVMHRGLIISVIQAVFSALYYYAAVAVYTGWLMVGYTSVYTMLPVLSLILDHDISDTTAFAFPELYKVLLKGEGLSLYTFFSWVFLSIYQGGLIMILGIVLFEESFINIVGITFTALVLVELGNVCMVVNKWQMKMIYAMGVSLLLYLISIVVLTSYFDILFVLTPAFIVKVCIIVACCIIPPFLVKFISNRMNPQDHIKLSMI